MDSTLDTSTNTLTAQIRHFSNYALLAELAPARFTLSDLMITEDKLNPDNPVTVQTLVTNTGGSAGKATLNLTLNTFGINKKEITLNANQSQTVSFTLKNLLPGQYMVDINGHSSQFTIEVPSGAIGDITPSPEFAATAASVPSNIVPTSPVAQITSPQTENKVMTPMLWLIIGLIMLGGLIAGIIFTWRKGKGL